MGLCTSTIGFLLLHVGVDLLEGAGELVGAGGGLAATADAAQTGDEVRGLHSFGEGGYAGCVAAATAVEAHLSDGAVVCDVDLNGAGACPRCIVSVCHVWKKFDWYGKNALTKLRIIPQIAK